MSEGTGTSDLAPRRTEDLSKVIRQLADIAAGNDDRATRATNAAEFIRSAGKFHWVGLYDVTAAEIRAIAWTGTEAPAFPTFPRSQGLNGVAVASGAPVISNDVRSDSRYLTTFGHTLSEAVVPVRSGNAIVGTIDVESDRAHAFSTNDEKFLLRCAEALEPLWRQ